MKTVSIVAAALLTLSATSAFAQQADNGTAVTAKAHAVVSTTEHARAIPSNKSRADVRAELAQSKTDSLHAHVLRDL